MFAELAAKRDRLERQLVAFAQEHRKSRDGDGVSNGAAEEAALREQLQLLAAEIVSLTAAAEGAGSPIHKALADAIGAAFRTGCAGWSADQPCRSCACASEASRARLTGATISRQRSLN